jgi:hypothetical protein
MESAAVDAVRNDTHPFGRYAQRTGEKAQRLADGDHARRTQRVTHLWPPQSRATGDHLIAAQGQHDGATERLAEQDRRNPVRIGEMRVDDIESEVGPQPPQEVQDAGEVEHAVERLTDCRNRQEARVMDLKVAIAFGHRRAGRGAAEEAIDREPRHWRHHFDGTVERHPTGAFADEHAVGRLCGIREDRAEQQHTHVLARTFVGR